MMPKLMGITQSAFDPASRVRLIQLIPYLEETGWQVCHRPNRPDRQWTSPFRVRLVRGIHYRAGRVIMKINRMRDIERADSYDVIFVNRDLSGRGLRLERRLLGKNPRVIFDFDDAIFIGRNEPDVRWMCQHAAWVTPGNEYLAEFARRYSDRVTVIPTVIDTDKYATKSYNGDESNGPLRVGWTGSDQSISTTLFPYLPMLEKLQEKLSFEFVIITNSAPKLPVSRLRWKFWKWNVEEESQLATRMDIGLMPLVDDEMQRGKCGLKLLQYMAAGLPTVASPVGVNKKITRRGITGFLAAEPEEWGSALERLINSPDLRASMGRAGRRVCEENYSIRKWLPTLLDIFEKVRKSEQ